VVATYQPSKLYLNHRENQHERILEVAEVLFIRNGIEKVNLSGMHARFGLLGDLIQQEYGQPALTIYYELCRVFLSGIQSSTISKEPEV